MFIVHYMTMIRVNVAEAKARLSQLLKSLKPGHVVVVCRRNVPIAEIRALPVTRTKARPIGLEKGRFKVGTGFFEPLPDDLIDAFEGKE